MNSTKGAVVLLSALCAMFAASPGYPAGQGHRTLDVTVTDIKGEMLFYKTSEGSTRNISVKIVEEYERVEDVKVGDKLVMEFDEGNQVIRVNRPNRFTVPGQLVQYDEMKRTVTLKLKDGRSQTYAVIPPVAIKMATVPAGTKILLDIDLKNNFVKDFERKS